MVFVNLLYWLASTLALVFLMFFIPRWTPITKRFFKEESNKNFSGFLHIHAGVCVFISILLLIGCLLQTYEVISFLFVIAIFYMVLGLTIKLSWNRLIQAFENWYE